MKIELVKPQRQTEIDKVLLYVGEGCAVGNDCSTVGDECTVGHTCAAGSNC